MSISNFNEVAEELLKLSKEIQQLQKQLNDEQQQRLQMEQTIQQLLDKLGKKKESPHCLSDKVRSCSRLADFKGTHYAPLFIHQKDHKAIEDKQCPSLDSTS